RRCLWAWITTELSHRLGPPTQRSCAGSASYQTMGRFKCFETHRSCDAPHRALGGIVGLAQAAVFEEAGERDPTLETVVDRLGGLVGALLSRRTTNWVATIFSV